MVVRSLEELLSHTLGRVAAHGLDPHRDGRHVMFITYLDINIQIYSPMDIYFDGYRGAPRVFGCVCRAPTHPFRYAREIPQTFPCVWKNGQTKERKGRAEWPGGRDSASFLGGEEAREEEVAASLSLSLPISLSIANHISASSRERWESGGLESGVLQGLPRVHEFES